MTSLLGSFGGSSSRSTASSGQAVPLKIRGSGGSLLKVRDGIGSVRLGKGIGRERSQIRSDIRGITEDVRSDILSLRSLENPFVRARVRPLENRFQALRDSTRFGLDRRGVAGTLATNELLRIDSEGERQLGDARAVASAEVLDGVLRRQSFLRTLQQDLRGLTEDEVAQALGELGLGSSSVANLIRQEGVQSSSQDSSKGLQNVARIGFGLSGLF